MGLYNTVGPFKLAIDFVLELHDGEIKESILL